MRLDYLRADPAGNRTILVRSPVPEALRASCAAALMADGWAEQVGFLSNVPSGLRLSMMGGEFCGNASLCAAAFAAESLGCFELELPLSVSGADAPVHCRVTKDGDGWAGRVQMPLPREISRRRMPLAEGSVELTAVELPGILHFIVPDALLPKENAPSLLRRWAELCGAPASGLLLLRESDMSMEPLVYVRDTDSTVWEHGCGSGTAAVGAYFALRSSGRVRISVSQPGGTLIAEAEAQNGRVVSLSVETRLRLLDRRTAELLAVPSTK